MKRLTVDDRRQIQLPEAKPGQVFEYEPSLDGTIKLVPVLSKAPLRRVIAKLKQEGTTPFFEIPKGYHVPSDAIANAVREERESRS